jgi:hypothetical protein
MSIVALGVAGTARAAIQNYDIIDTFATSGFSASWLHSAENSRNGTLANGARMNGQTSSRISGTLTGDLVGNILSGASGSVSGTLKQLSVYLNSEFSTTFIMSTPFQLLLGGQASGGDGALEFETAGAGKFTGGFLDFSLFVNGGLTSLVDGTFFFKPQAESGNAALSPNRGTSSEFTLWGANWMHDGDPMDGGAEPDWSTFLAGLNYGGPSEVLRELASGDPGIPATLGIDLYIKSNGTTGQGGGGDVPEPLSAVVWGILVCVGAARCGRGREFGRH